MASPGTTGEDSIAGASFGIGPAGGVTMRTLLSLLVPVPGTIFGCGIGSLLTGAPTAPPTPPTGAPQAPLAQVSQVLQQLLWQQNMPRRRLNRPQPQLLQQLSPHEVWQVGWQQDCWQHEVWQHWQLGQQMCGICGQQMCGMHRRGRWKLQQGWQQLCWQHCGWQHCC
jgi:hypothetical protein